MEKKILIVEDIESVQKVLNKVLSRSDEEYTVEWASSAEAAESLMRDKPFHLVFIDLNLPDGNGLKLCEILRKNYPASIYFAITGFDSKFTFLECRRHGFDDYFKKPFDFEAVSDAAAAAFKCLGRWSKLDAMDESGS